MVGTTTNRGSSKRHPQVAVVVAVSVNGIRADRRIGGKSATGLLVGKQNWVETCDGGQIGFVFPERFTTLWISRTQALRRSQPPNRSDIHCHDSAAARIKPYVELAGTCFGRATRRRVKILIPRNAGRCRIRPTEASAAATARAR